MLGVFFCLELKLLQCLSKHYILTTRIVNNHLTHLIFHGTSLMEEDNTKPIPI